MKCSLILCPNCGHEFRKLENLTNITRAFPVKTAHKLHFHLICLPCCTRINKIMEEVRRICSDLCRKMLFPNTSFVILWAICLTTAFVHIAQCVQVFMEKDMESIRFVKLKPCLFYSLKRDLIHSQ